MSEIDFTRYDASKPIREITYEALKDAIISGAILPGERIVESNFAKRFNISRTPIREALRKLEQDGLIEYTPRRGVVVRSLRTEDINEIYIIREALEALALTHAIKNVTPEGIASLRETLREIAEHVDDGDIDAASKRSRDIHIQIYRMCGMERLVSIYNSLDEYMDRFSYMSLTDEARRHDAAREHGAIIDALAACDLETLLAVSKAHLEGARVNCILAYERRRKQAEEALLTSKN